MSNNTNHRPLGAPFGELPETPQQNRSGHVKKESTKAAYDRKHQQYSQTQQELQDLMKERVTSPHMSQAESQAKNKEITDLTEQAQKLSNELAELKRQHEQAQTLIGQQQATIRNQSQAIQNPRPGFTPAQGFSGYNLTSLNHPATMPSLQRPFQNPGAQRGTPITISANEFGSPEIQQRPPPFNPGHGSSSTGTRGLTPISGPVPYPTNVSSNSSGPAPTSTALIKSPDSIVPNDVKIQIDKVLNMCQQYAYAHVNFPSTFGDQQLPKALKDKLIAAATQHTAFNLLNKPETRYFLVSKIMLDWLIKHVLKPSVWKGFSKAVDNSVNEHKNQIYETTPAALRYLHLTSMSNQLRAIQQRPGFQPFFATTVKARANELWLVVKPLMHNKTTKDWDDLHFLVNEAHRLAEIMFVAGAVEYKFDFPNFNMPFNLSTMVSREPGMENITAADLNKRRAFVRLSISPAVHVRRNEPEGDIKVALLVPAQVLLK